ncbi:MAG TPA: S8 family serine peptidase [Thermoanaerobaculia bacterium]|jgi:subtilisin family serine protease
MIPTRSSTLLGGLFIVAVAVSVDAAEVKRPPFSVPDQYIVVLDPKQNLAPQQVAAELARAHGGRVGIVWNDAINGFTIRIPDAAATAIARDHRVIAVEQNSEIFLSTSQNTTTAPEGTAAGAGSLWALDRSDQQALPLDGQFNYCDTGFGVKIYVVDSGVLKTHQEFYTSATDTNTRVANGAAFTTINGDGVNPIDRYPAPNESVDYGTNPCNVLTSSGYAQSWGHHGTSVASLAAGRLTGTAKAATVVPVKVIRCDGKGYVSDAISGLNWILQQHLNDPSVPKVVNMSMYYWLPGTAPTETCSNGNVVPSITTSQFTSFETAIQTLVGNNITVVVSANNHNQDARNFSPSRLAYGNTALTGPHVITVGGSMLVNGVDTRWIAGNPTYNFCTNGTAGTNWGVAVDLFAPSHNITAASIGLPTNSPLPWGYRTVAQGRDGTSFAAPLVAGVVARFLQVTPGATATDVWQHLQNLSTYGAIAPSSLSGSPNRLLRRVGAAVCKVRS